jgi:hypothetical protein
MQSRTVLPRSLTGLRAARHGHPFRQAHRARLGIMPAGEKPRGDDQDWKLFVLSFGAFFTVFYSFVF